MILRKEIIAICQPTYNDCIIMWNKLSLEGEAVMPQTEEEWLKDKKYILENYPTACQELGDLINITL